MKTLRARPKHLPKGTKIPRHCFPPKKKIFPFKVDNNEEDHQTKGLKIIHPNLKPPAGMLG